MLLWGSIIALFVFLLALGVVCFKRDQGVEIVVTRTGARALHPVVEKWVVDHPRSCPTTDDLLRAKEVATPSAVVDGWGVPFRIECDFDGGEVYVKSDGRDHKRGTADDIVTPSDTRRR